MLEVLALALETEQGVIGEMAALAWVVVDSRLFLVAVDNQHSGVDIEDESRRGLRPNRHTVQQLRRFDQFEPEDHRVQHRHEHLADTVPVIALGNGDFPSQQPL